MAVYKDDRTDDQKRTHTVFVAGTDKFLSGWGDAKGGASVAVWACRPDDARSVFDWVKDRGDMSRVRYVSNPRKCKAAHVHVYVVDESHPALTR